MIDDEEELQRVQLTRGLHLTQRRRGHRVATDDVLCAWAGWRARPDARRVLDLGAGHGAVTLMLAGALPEAHLVAIEAQRISFELLARNLRDNGLAHRVEAREGDLRGLALPGPGFDLITGTPPFMPVGSGTLPADPQRAAARFELRGGVEHYCRTGARHLAPDGLLSLVMDAARPGRYEAAIAAAGLALVGRLTVRPREEAAPSYLVYQATRAAAPGVPVEELALIIRDAAGAYSEAFRAARLALDLPGS